MIKLPRQYGNLTDAALTALGMFHEQDDHILIHWINQQVDDCPVYIADPKLLDCFCNGPLPPADPEYKAVLPSFTVALPLNFMTREYGYKVDFLWFAYAEKHDAYRVFAIATKDGKLFQIRGTFSPRQPILNPDQPEPDLTHLINRISINVLLTLSYGKKLIGPCETRGRVYQPSEKPPTGRYYRYLGKDYQGCSNEPLGGSHASPRSHWRKGHYRWQSCGPKHADRRMTWIESMWIGDQS